MIARAATRAARWSLREYLGGDNVEELVCPQPTLPDPRPTLELQYGTATLPIPPSSTHGSPPGAQAEAAAPAQSLAVADCAHVEPDSGYSTPQPCDQGPPKPLQWALLLPTTSRGCRTPTQFWQRFSMTLTRLRTSILLDRTTVYLAVDMADPVLDSPEALARIRESLSGVSLRCVRLPPAFAGNVCWIWAAMAKTAVHGGADLFMLVGDDVHFAAHGWQAAVEESFSHIAADTGLPFGCACVTVPDDSFPAFPTFPVLHRSHLRIFSDLFPRELTNQHGDPFVWEVYRRWGASRFAPPPARLRNCIGGAGDARYVKRSDCVWRDSLLSGAIDTLARHLAHTAPHAAQIPCLDVIIPTYRCDPEHLLRLSTLPCPSSYPVSLHTLIIVDKPDSVNVHAIRNLASCAPNRTVRVYVMPANGGASAARNAGLRTSFGDYAVLLDDDVEPQENLLPAYLGAIARYPRAPGFVGLTVFPPPKTLMQRAVVASGICLFHGIADRMRHPPWGITANLCVRARTNNAVWFSSAYPKTGGGEDIEYCVRLRQLAGGDLVSVPGAVVCHPFWPQPLKQTTGWAAGDVKCLDALPTCTYFAAPNWALLALASLLCLRPAWALLAALLEASFLATAAACAADATVGAVVAQWHVFAASALPMMVQDVVRVESKLRRGRFAQLLRHFDWLNGDADYAKASQVSLLFKCLAWAVAVTACETQHGRFRAMLCCGLAAALAAWVRLHGERGRLLPRRVACHAGPQLQLPQCSAMPFVVLASPCVGASSLCGLLHNVPGVSMHAELFNEYSVQTHASAANVPTTDIHKRDADPERFLMCCLDVGASHGCAVGFTLFPEHMRRSTAHASLCARLLADGRVKKVVLRRGNRAAAAVLRLRAAVVGSCTQAGLGAVRVRIAPEQLQAAVESYNAYYAYLERATAGQAVVWMSYEALCAAPLRELARVCAHVGVPPPAELPCNIFQPQTSGPLRAVVDNFDELARVFAGDARSQDFECDAHNGEEGSG